MQGAPAPTDLSHGVIVEVAHHADHADFGRQFSIGLLIHGSLSRDFALTLGLMPAQQDPRTDYCRLNVE